MSVVDVLSSDPCLAFGVLVCLVSLVALGWDARNAPSRWR